MNQNEYENLRVCPTHRCLGRSRVFFQFYNCECPLERIAQYALAWSSDTVAIFIDPRLGPQEYRDVMHIRLVMVLFWPGHMPLRLRLSPSHCIASGSNLEEQNFIQAPL